MLAKNIYPKCASTFRSWLLTNTKFNKLYYELGEPVPFDVTLRDGLQALSKEQQNEFTTNKKLEIYKYVLDHHEIKNIEIGSITSEKALPIFKDTMQMLESTKNNHATNYILVPNKKNLNKIIDNAEVKGISLITSVSNSFQMKNTKMNLRQSDEEIAEMFFELYEHKSYENMPSIKLYVSCINECPIEGKLDNDFVVNRILTLSKMNVENICLSDTCGTITTEDFEYIIENCLFFGLAPSKVSLHLHVKDDRKNDVERLIHKALDYKINKFDVSYLKTGGCSVTMEKSSLAPNLCYDLYYKALQSYILKNAKK